MSDKEFVDVGDDAYVKKAKKKYQLDHERAMAHFEKVLSTPEGRAVIWRILEQCGVGRASFTGDANHTFFREGQRKIGQEIIAMFKELPGDKGDDLIHKMTVEANRRERGET